MKINAKKTTVFVCITETVPSNLILGQEPRIRLRENRNVEVFIYTLRS